MKIIIKNCIYILALVCATGCDDYQRKGIVTPEITVNAKSLNLFVDETAQLTASPTELTFTWMSEDDDVATVNDLGLVVATGDGTTFIVVRSGDMTRKTPVTAVTRIPLTGFSLNVESITINRTVKTEIWAILDPTNTNDASLPIWRSLNTDIATVDYKGLITGVSSGATSVTCSINGTVKSVSVTVN
jgi:hypothetical protein